MMDAPETTKAGVVAPGTNKTASALQAQMSMRDMEDYIQPTKNKMRNLYNTLFTSAKMQENTELEKAHALLYKNLMIEASRGIKALEECSLIVNVDKAKLINRGLSPEQINESVNQLLKRCLTVPKAMQTLRAYLSRLELAEIEPTLKALTSDDRENKHVEMLRKLLKIELRAECVRLERLKRKYRLDQLKEKRDDQTQQTQQTLKKKADSIIKVLAEQKTACRERDLVSFKERRRRNIERESKEIEGQLRRLKAQISAARKDREDPRFRPEINKSLRVVSEKQIADEKIREAYKRDYSRIHYLSEYQHVNATDGCKQPPGPLSSLYLKYMKAKRLSPIRSRSKGKSCFDPDTRPRPTLHLSAVSNPQIAPQSTRVPAKSRRLLNASATETRGRKSLSPTPRLGVQQSSRSTRNTEAEGIIRGCENLYRKCARNMGDLARREDSVADLYASLRRQLDNVEDRANTKFINRQIELEIKQFRRAKGCFVYGSKGRGMYMLTKENGRVDAEAEKRRGCKLKACLHRKQDVTVA